MNEYKKLPRLYLPENQLSEEQAHYLRHVMRRNVGDRIRVFDGKTGEWLADITEVSKKTVRLDKREQLREQTAEAGPCVLASPIRKDRFELMIEKACELGAARFQPVICEHTVLHKFNIERLQAIAIEAAEQSERLTVMQVEEPLPLKAAVSDHPFILFCAERQDAPLLRDKTQKNAAVLIGPEGGFSDVEMSFLSLHKNITPVTLGPRILRAETAMILALGGVQLLS